VAPRQGSGSSRHGHPITLALALLLALAPGAARAGSAAVRIAALEPVRTDSVLACVVVTRGLPDGPMRETLASGLPSSLTLSLVLLDERGHERGGTTAEVRIEPDPWERTFLVRSPAGGVRVASLEALAESLHRLGPLALAPWARVPARAPLRVRARLAVHALAPAEADRARAAFVGDVGSNGAERREVSAGLGPLLRFFLGRAPASDWNADATSPSFTSATLEHRP